MNNSSASTYTTAQAECCKLQDCPDKKRWSAKTHSSTLQELVHMETLYIVVHWCNETTMMSTSLLTPYRLPAPNWHNGIGNGDDRISG